LACVLAGHRGEVWLKEGPARLEVALPASPNDTSRGEEADMGGVVIGVDPHKASATIEVVDEREIVRATGRFGTDSSGYRQLLGYVRQWLERVWPVPGDAPVPSAVR